MKPIKNKILKPLFPNQGVEAAYRRKLEALIDAMHKSISYWVKTKYKNNEPAIAMDAVLKRFERRYGIAALSVRTSQHAELLPKREPAGDGAAIAFDEGTPASALRIAINKLVKRWQKRFDQAAIELAEYFEQDVEDRTDARMKRILKDGGFTVQFRMTPAMKDIAKATVNANVSLIKSIPQQYLRNVEGIVMRSVQTGRDLGPLAKDLEKQYGVTKRRAALIARDQNNKATSAFQRARQQELGITRAVWMHSHAGKEPRPTHVKMNGKSYDVNEGMWDSAVGEYIFPGQLINCRCTSRSVVPGFE